MTSKRVLLVVGVEGAGHEIMKAMWTHVFDTAKVLEMPTQWGCGREWSPNAVLRMVRIFRRIRRRELWTMPHSMTFPQCGNATNHRWRVESAHPRIDLIAEAAQKANVELHVVLLHRQLKDCLLVDCFIRDREACAPQAETLNKNAQILADQIIQSIDLAHVSCLQYGHPFDMEKSIRKALGFKTEADLLVQQLLDEIVPGAVRRQVADWANISQSMSDGNMQLSKVCQEANQVDLADVKAMLTAELGPSKPADDEFNASAAADWDEGAQAASVVVPPWEDDSGEATRRHSGFNCCRTCPHCICCEEFMGPVTE